MSRITLEIEEMRYRRRARAERLPVELHLRRKGVWRTQSRRRGLTLACLEGVAWVTLTGDPNDHILRKGQTLTVAQRGRILVEALRDARLRVA
jgi:hypothetical protein